MANHDWIKSTLGHGEQMCRRCLITNREAAVLDKINECPAPGETGDGWEYPRKCKTCGGTGVTNAKASALQSQFTAIAETLKLIAAHDGMTLIEPSIGEDFDRGHQVGANKAFNQMAELANAALTPPATAGDARKTMGEHLVNGEFQSDKYPTTPRGKVPLSCKDKTAQDLLWEYAQRRRVVDAVFAEDLEAALRIAGYIPPSAEAKPGLTEADCQLLDRAADRLEGHFRITAESMRDLKRRLTTGGQKS